MAKRSAVSTMLDYAEEQNINLIVVGTRGRSGIKKMLLGIVARANIGKLVEPSIEDHQKYL